jgi:putative SOS response-associated peptidase YedK
MCFSAMRAKITGEQVYKTEYLQINKIQIRDFSGLDPNKIPGEDGRFYPKWWTQVLRSQKGQLEFVPMRYQLLPHFCKENKYTHINPKTNRKKEIPTFNARIDGLDNRLAWKNIFGKTHGVIALEAFYEWVSDRGKPRLIQFKPKEDKYLWAACLWDRWTGKEQTLESFAIVTDLPHPDVLAKGHDRTPVFLEEKVLEYWLNPKNESKDELYEILQQQKQLRFEWSWVD